MQCNEKRISRKHGLLKLTQDGSLILEAMHTNPCFHKNRNTSLEVPLFKGQTVKLKTGDQFGLLQDSFWYRVLVPEPEITKNILEHNVLQAPADTTKGPHIPVENVADNLSCITVTNEPSDVVANGSSPVKRKLPAWMSKYQEKIDRNVSPKKLKTETNPTPSTSALKITNESVGTSASKESNAKKKQRVQSKAHQMSQSGDEDTSMPAFDGHKVKKEQDAQPELSDDDDNVDKLSFGNGQHKVLKEETTASENVHQLSDGDTDLSDTEAKAEFQTKTGESKNLSKDSKDRCGTNDQHDTTPAINSTPRTMCIYGHKCYSQNIIYDVGMVEFLQKKRKSLLAQLRKHPDHKKKFSHPGDIDYDTSFANLPECPYGLGCYRKHKGHWQAYKHTKVHQRKPRKTHGKSSEEDDYSLSDSFLNDGSSDDYQPTDLDSDSDSVNDEVDEPDMKRMKKEAKKFVKKK
uniref:PBZ-type domain-containing protein n=1 Tax=Timema monikensis TaxID=170555 RepID=A0A7R9EBM3_9NEOP|nr:unnamed protein product [Timema monikensis]